MSQAQHLLDEMSKQIPEIRAFLDELIGESDRAMAVLGAAELDFRLREMLATYLGGDQGKAKRLLDGPLGSLAHRASIAYCLEIIGDIEYQELDRVRDVRNKFAHQLQGLTFESELIGQKCEKLALPERMVATVNRELDGTAKQRYWMSVFGLSLVLRGRKIAIDRYGKEAAHHTWTAKWTE